MTKSRLFYSFVSGGCAFTALAYLGDWKTCGALVLASVWMLYNAATPTEN